MKYSIIISTFLASLNSSSQNKFPYDKSLEVESVNTLGKFYKLSLTI